MLVDLVTNIAVADQATQRSFFYDYYEKRRIDLLTPPTPVRVKRSSKGKAKRDKKGTIKVSLSQLEELKKLGLVT